MKIQGKNKRRLKIQNSLNQCNKKYSVIFNKIFSLPISDFPINKLSSFFLIKLLVLTINFVFKKNTHLYCVCFKIHQIAESLSKILFLVLSNGGIKIRFQFRFTNS